MRILFGCEFYSPSVGGVQEVMRQVAERLVLRGHEVTAATTRLADRTFSEFNGVKIKEFSVSGNMVRGMEGEVEAYRDFILNGDFDAIMVKAAQQWTFDALWPVLPQIKARKVFVPCGFSGLYLPEYRDYFEQMPQILRGFDHLVFYASDYRDINFAREHGIEKFSVIPNGASEKEFSLPPDPTFRQRHGIGIKDLLFLTVGSFTGIKGHAEVARAFAQMKLEQPATLILNGNIPVVVGKENSLLTNIKSGLKRSIKAVLQELGVLGREPWREIADRVNKSQGNKRIILANLPRPELVQAFFSADLFVFASNVEYSPLVLFEAAAAGTPFLSVPVGNASEIAAWTGGGEICPAETDARGYTRVKPEVLAGHMEALVKDKGRLHDLGEKGRRNWLERFTWEKIVVEYEKVLFSGS